MLPGATAAVGCSVVLGAASPEPRAGSPVPWPAVWPGSTSDAALQELKLKKREESKIRKSNTYRSDRRWAAVNLLLARPVGACAPTSATCGAAAPLATRSVATGAVSGRFRGRRTNEGAASSSSSSSSTIRTSRRRFGAWLLSAGRSAGSSGVGKGSAGNGLFPATLSSEVGTGRARSSSGGTSPTGSSIPGASDTYTAHRSTSPTCKSNRNESTADDIRIIKLESATYLWCWSS